MRVVLIKGRSAYDALRAFTDGCAEAFRRRGFDTTIIDAAESAEVGPALAAAAADGPVRMVHSFSILGDYRDESGRTVGDIAGAPHVIQLVDHPLAHMMRLDRTSRSAAVLVVDHSHVDAIRSVYGAEHFAHVGFCPHAAVGDPALGEPDADAFAAARPIPILFCGTFYKDETPPWAAFEPRVRRVFDQALEMALAEEFLPALEALDQAMRSAGLDPAGAGFHDFRRNAVFVHEQVRAHRRFALLKAVIKAGLPVHVYGKGYESQLYRFKAATYGGEADFAEVTQLMRRSRVVLNINANFGQGSHERPLTALLAGSAAASDHSTFYAEMFRPGEDIALYRWKSLTEGLSAIADLAESPEAAFSMARAGQARVIAGHRWDHRIDTLLAAADASRARLGVAA